MPIPYAVCEEIRRRAGNKCEGLYKRHRDGITRIGNCPCRGRYRLVLAHIYHRGMVGAKSRDTAGNILQLCQYGHDLFDDRISQREFKRLMGLPENASCFTPNHKEENGEVYM
jgi:hypothetical protein